MAAVQSNVNMEDHSEVKVGNGALFVGVYDGYKGHVQENDNNMSLDIPRKVVSEIETGFIEFARRHYVQLGQPKIGIVSSGCLICIIERRTLYLANVGDSRAILGSKMGIGPFKRLCVKQMARDHSCNNQNIRDELAVLHDDNWICNYNDGAWRVRNTSSEVSLVSGT
ncbi:probable protein phosphatase 2C 43 [Medicago truncatula]|uniref:probable protein phosphatase 2C 43 n=1 Tax=Medicago truncatula TaxID=3880 RepID=UPI001966E22B|nr:probable protein phosphatase 2C 43 [Medicago truncatula]